MNRILSGATTPGQSGPESAGNEGVSHIPQCSSITGSSLSDRLVSYLGRLLRFSGLTLLQRYSQGILQYQPTGLKKKVCMFTYVHLNRHVEMPLNVNTFLHKQTIFARKGNDIAERCDFRHFDDRFVDCENIPTNLGQYSANCGSFQTMQ